MSDTTTAETKKKSNRKPISERDQGVAELQVMQLCKHKIDQLRSGAARMRVVNYLQAAMEDRKNENTPPKPDPRQPDLPATDPASAVKPGAIDGGLP